MRRVLVIVLLLGGCAESMDRITATDFMPAPDGSGFTFKTLIAPQYPDSPEGEASRMKMLESWLTDNNVCARGYDIVNRQVIKRSVFVQDIYYSGKCKK